ncbi:hypothetical protein [Pseudofulvimonas gallinarii]|uniref:Uncharacterized protein n=1 Tax=Pseudofulvimonas gallinarii TaxID=634155 RepID=A0A4S3KTV8_9GAMM|nr:hypothetical protein [Pseudofulvimonas gallinarii]TCS95992.1 hypothetical protein EDC25_1172 [Pseudofulvimonas gallinarii]THD12599.1 hypothetical protein B1808_12190 [Pseudofulvimonas gallinarii]
MCYSAQVEQRFQAYVRRFGADIDIHEFVRRYGACAEGERFKTARGLDLAILADPDPAWCQWHFEYSHYGNLNFPTRL